jgi:transposase InsO family protein
MLLQAAHDHMNHCGTSKMRDALLQRVWWPHLAQSVKNYKQSCLECQQRGTNHDRKSNSFAILTNPTAYFPGQLWSIDFITDLPKSANLNRCIIVAVCHFSKYTIAHECADKSAETVCNFIIANIVHTFGYPESILTDQGGEFINHLNDWLCDSIGTRHRRTTPYHPACNGQVERMNAVIKNGLSKFCENEVHNDWDSFITMVTFGMNIQIHSVTGFTPYFLMYGREARGTLDTFLPKIDSFRTLKRPDHRKYATEVLQNLEYANLIVAENLRQAHAKYFKPIAILETYRSFQPSYRAFYPGDLVMLYTPRVALHDKAYATKQASGALTKFWRGPFTIVDMITPVTFSFSSNLNSIIHCAHVSRLKRYYPSSIRLTPTTILNRIYLLFASDK